MSRKENATATAEAAAEVAEVESTETEKKEKGLAVRMKAAIAGFATAIEAAVTEGVTLTLPQDVYDTLVALGNEVVAKSVRGLPFEVRLKQINDEITALWAAMRDEDGNPVAMTDEQSKKLEDLFVKKRNLQNRQKSETKGTDEASEETPA